MDQVQYILACAGTVSLLTAVYGGFGKRRWNTDSDINRKVPPSWGPHMRDYPLRQWIQDIAEWCTLCDYQPHQQGIAIKKQLQGSAALFAEQYT